MLAEKKLRVQQTENRRPPPCSRHAEVTASSFCVFSFAQSALEGAGSPGASSIEKIPEHHPLLAQRALLDTIQDNMFPLSEPTHLSTARKYTTVSKT